MEDVKQDLALATQVEGNIKKMIKKRSFLNKYDPTKVDQVDNIPEEVIDVNDYNLYKVEDIDKHFQ